LTDEAVLAANESFYQAFNQRDFEAMTMIWAHSVPISCIHPGWNVLSGHEAVLGSWRSILDNPGQPRLISGGASVQVIGAMATVVCRELVNGIPLLATNVFVREEGDWRLMHHHSGQVAQVAE
jgi:ketosteroid isomerase-like protein